MQEQTTGKANVGFFADLGEGWRVEIVSWENGSGEVRIFENRDSDPTRSHLNCKKLVDTAKRLYTEAAAIPRAEERWEFLKKVLIPTLGLRPMLDDPFSLTVPSDHYEGLGLAAGDQVKVEPYADWKDNGIVYWLRGTPFHFTGPNSAMLCRARREGDIILVFHPDDDPNDPLAGVEAGPGQIWPVTKVMKDVPRGSPKQ